MGICTTGRLGHSEKMPRIRFYAHAECCGEKGKIRDVRSFILGEGDLAQRLRALVILQGL